jgi:hypothetical protein
VWTDGRPGIIESERRHTATFAMSHMRLLCIGVGVIASEVAVRIERGRRERASERGRPAFAAETSAGCAPPARPDVWQDRNRHKTTRRILECRRRRRLSSSNTDRRTHANEHAHTLLGRHRRQCRVVSSPAPPPPPMNSRVLLYLRTLAGTASICRHNRAVLCPSLGQCAVVSHF